MAKRYVKKKKKKRRAAARLGALLLLLAVVILGIVLLATSSCRQETPPEPAADALWDDAPRGAGWYQDDLGLINGDKALIKGMETFEKKTGVKPFLTLLYGVDPDELDVFVQDQYDALFSDGGHLLVVYDEWEDDAYCLAARAGGTGALSREDVDRVLDCLEAAYSDPANDSYAAAFGAGFARGAKAVTSSVAAGSGAGLLLVLGLVLLVLCGALVLLLRKRARAIRRDAFMADED